VRMPRLEALYSCMIQAQALRRTSQVATRPALLALSSGFFRESASEAKERLLAVSWPRSALLAAAQMHHVTVSKHVSGIQDFLEQALIVH